MDEFTEFDRRALEILREPIETGVISISRAVAKAEFPARFQLIAAMNPCPNGCDIDQYGQCQCSHEQLTRYQRKLSAPLLDRIDIQISVPRLPNKELIANNSTAKEDWHLIRSRIIDAKNIQVNRQGIMNGLLEGKQMHQVCKLSSDTKSTVLMMLEKLNISVRAYHRILKIARTIADYEQSTDITHTHMAEAMSYRQFDRTTNSKL